MGDSEKIRKRAIKPAFLTKTLSTFPGGDGVGLAIDR